MKSGLILKNSLISRRILVGRDSKKGDDKTGNKNTKTLPLQGLDDLKDEQRTRIELLLEEMTESGASPEGIRHAIKHAHDKEIIFAVRIPEGQDPTPQLRLR